MRRDCPRPPTEGGCPTRVALGDPLCSHPTQQEVEPLCVCKGLLGPTASCRAQLVGKKCRAE
eukprot:8733653-Prorocentrum_lima.AAC.1